MELGPEVEAFTPGRSGKRALRVIGGIFAVFGAYMIGNELFMQPAPRTGGLIFAAGLAGVGVWVHRRGRRAPVRYIVHEDGFRIEGPKGATSFPYQGLSIRERVDRMSVRIDSSRTQQIRTHTWTCESPSGDRATIVDVMPMKKIVAEALARRRWVELRSRIRSGKSVTLHDVTIDIDGISHGDDHVLWRDMDEIRFGTHVTVSTRDGTKEWTTATLLYVLSYSVLRLAAVELSNAKAVWSPRFVLTRS
ncbi:MAG: hypothetical protein AAF389_05370 [Gemmatimonadota bacterium]